MITQLGELLLMVAGFLLALGALLAILDRIESSLDDAVAMRSDGPYLNVSASSADSVGLPAQRRHYMDRAVINDAPEPDVATHPPG